MYSPPPQLTFDERHRHHIAEVIETSTTSFVAQCLEPDDLSFPFTPPFGSWVKATDEQSDNQIFGVVSFVTTTPIDSLHRARALGLSLAELREQQPQIFAMLKTEFRAAIVGFETSETAPIPHQVYHYLPPRPPQVHQGVYGCTTEEVLHFTQGFDFIRTLLQVSAAPVDSLVAATLREVYILRKADRAWLVQAGRTLGTLLKDDYDRLRLILSQIHVQ